jgi:hypothetical protein
VNELKFIYNKNNFDNYFNHLFAEEGIDENQYENYKNIMKDYVERLEAHDIESIAQKNLN